MNNRKFLGIVSLFFASICIRFPLNPMSMNQNARLSEFQDNVIPVIINVITLFLFAYGIVQMFVGFIVEDLPALRQISMKSPDVSTKS